MNIIFSTKELSALISELPNYTSKSKIDNNEVLVTGGAGFLGIHLLKQLVEDRKFEKIYTIVRNPEKLIKQAQYFKLNTDFLKEIYIIKGDLLELPEDNFPNVSHIIHSAAQIHCIKTLKQLWKNNVLATKKIADIYKNNNISFISTLSVFVSSNKKGNHIEESIPINTNYLLYGGYAQSKFICEKIIENIQQKIYRLGLITGASYSGVFPNDFFSMIIKELKSLQTYPEKFEDSFVDLTPVDFCAKKISDTITNNDKIIHIANIEATSLNSIIKHLQLEPIKNIDWLEKLSTKDNMIQILLKYAFFKKEMIQTHFEYFNIDLFQSTNHKYNITEKFLINNEELVKIYCDNILKDENEQAI